MKKKSLLLLLLPVLLLGACSSNKNTTNNPGQGESTPSEPEQEPTDPEGEQEPSEPSEPTTPTEPEEPAEPSEPSEPTTPTEPEEPAEPSEPTTPEEPITPEEPSEPSEPAEPAEPSTPEEPTTPATPEDDEDEESWEYGRTLLSCGYYQMDIPSNSKNPYELKTTLSADSTTWCNNEMYDELPDNFRYIYKNSCNDGPSGHKCSEDFYSYNSKKIDQYPGGLKFDRPGTGFQTNMFTHTGAKLEIRLKISMVANNNKKPEKGKDTAYIYYFNKEGKLLGDYAFEEGSITAQDKNTYKKIYCTESYTSEIAYFEFRVNTYPYKGSQCYNFGISECNFKSWERA